MATHFIWMCTISRICTHTHRVDCAGDGVSDQNIMQTIQITIDANNILTEQSAPQQKHDNQTFSTQSTRVIHSYSSDVGPTEKRKRTNRKNNWIRIKVEIASQIHNKNG